jgi:hypothetical protein
MRDAGSASAPGLEVWGWGESVPGVCTGDGDEVCSSVHGGSGT